MFFFFNLGGQFFGFPFYFSLGKRKTPIVSAHTLTVFVTVFQAHRVTFSEHSIFTGISFSAIGGGASVMNSSNILEGGSCSLIHIFHLLV